MSDFVAFFPTSAHKGVPASFAMLDSLLRGPLRADHVHSDVKCGAPLLISRSFGRTPRLRVREDGSGWIVVKGILFDTGSEWPQVDLDQLWECVITGESKDLNRYEGTFALAAWDARKAQGWALNDQSSTMNLYYGEHDGGLYVATHALTLAHVLGLGLDPIGVQEFLIRSVSFAPSTLFAGLQRVDVGEHIRYGAGMLSRARHWYGYAHREVHGSVDEAGDAVASSIVDRISRYAAVAHPVLCDLTGGLDTRTLVSAAQAAGVGLVATVNGTVNSEDVRIARQLAERVGLELKHFDTQTIWTQTVTPDMRRELTYRSSGELPFTAIYHHIVTRPLLGQDFGLHMMGTGGDFYRTFPWEESLKMRYPVFTHDRLPDDLFVQDLFRPFYARFRSRIDAIRPEEGAASITQRLDAAFIWKMTSHCSLYLSAVHNWLPSVAPLMSAGVLKAALAVPWTMRLGSQVQRYVIYRLSPHAAAVESWNSGSLTRRGTAEPSIANLGVEVRRYTGRALRAVDRRLFRGRMGNGSLGQVPIVDVPVPFVTPEFREFLDPKAMSSRYLYSADGLAGVLRGDDGDWQRRSNLLARLATIEQLCRELAFHPEPDFWSPVLSQTRWASPSSGTA